MLTRAVSPVTACEGCQPGRIGTLSWNVSRNYASYAPHTCSDGHKNGSALCSQCEEGYASFHKKCRRCGLGAGHIVYLLLPLAVTLVYFPVLRNLCAVKFKSLYTILPFLQFLGVYSDFDVRAARKLNRHLLQTSHHGYIVVIRLLHECYMTVTRVLHTAGALARGAPKRLRDFFVFQPEFGDAPAAVPRH